MPEMALQPHLPKRGFTWLLPCEGAGGPPALPGQARRAIPPQHQRACRPPRRTRHPKFVPFLSLRASD